MFFLYTYYVCIINSTITRSNEFRVSISSVLFGFRLSSCIIMATQGLTTHLMRSRKNTDFIRR